MPSEQRHSTRTRVDTQIDLVDDASTRVLGQLINISSGGLMVISNAEIPINTLFQLSFEFTGNDQERQRVAFGAQVLWSKDLSGSGTYWYGFQIIDISEADLGSINQLVESWQG